MKTIENIRNTIQNRKARSAWDKGVKLYALELLDNIDDPDEQLANEKLLYRTLLNGAADWQQYSEGGCALYYDQDIAERLCTKQWRRRLRKNTVQPIIILCMEFRYHLLL
jgi:hypothetical protein